MTTKKSKKVAIKKGNAAMTITGLAAAIIILSFVMLMFAMLFSNTQPLKTGLMITDIIMAVIIIVMQVKFRREIKLAMKEM